MSEQEISLESIVQRRDEWLRLAYQDTPEAANAVLLTQAEFQLDRQQHEQALATLRRLDEDSKDHAQGLALMGRVYYQLEDFDALAELLPRIRKHSQVTPEILETWTIRVHKEALDHAADGDALALVWKKIKKPLRNNISVLEAYYEGLMRTGMHKQAEKELAAALRSEWRGPLVRLFGLVESENASKQLKRAEGWLANHSDDADLLLTSARLCLRNELWGKAQSYLETAISLRPTPETYQEYGSLLNQLGDVDGSANAYRDGLGLVTALPLPAIEHLPDATV
jgi:HemY protein